MSDLRSRAKFAGEGATAEQTLRLLDERDAWEKYGREAREILRACQCDICICGGERICSVCVFLSQPSPLTSTPSPETKEGK